MRRPKAAKQKQGGRSRKGAKKAGRGEERPKCAEERISIVMEDILVFIQRGFPQRLMTFLLGTYYLFSSSSIALCPYLYHFVTVVL